MSTLSLLFAAAVTIAARFGLPAAGRAMRKADEQAAGERPRT